jgi:acyl carrier protein
MAVSREDIFKEVQEVMVDALGVDEDEVAQQATLMGDLGAESIDFLDIVFRLEKAFEIKIPREELFPAKITEKGLVELKNAMPHTDFESFANDPDINKLGDLFTVNSVVNFVELKLRGAG